MFSAQPSRNKGSSAWNEASIKAGNHSQGGQFGAAFPSDNKVMKRATDTAVRRFTHMEAHMEAHKLQSVDYFLQHSTNNRGIMLYEVISIKQDQQIQPRSAKDSFWQAKNNKDLKNL